MAGEGAAVGAEALDPDDVGVVREVVVEEFDPGGTAGDGDGVFSCGSSIADCDILAAGDRHRGSMFRIAMLSVNGGIFSKFAASPQVVDDSAAAATMVWKYVGELCFNMLVLVGAVKMSDQISKSLFGLI